MGRSAIAAMLFATSYAACCAGCGERPPTPNSTPNTPTTRLPAPPLAADATFGFQFGQGSGLDGLDLLKVAADGNAVYEYQPSAGDWRRKSFLVDKRAMEELVAKLNSLRVMEMDDVYDGEIEDGTQWLLLIKHDGRSKSIYFNNKFPSQIEQLSGFVHKTIIEPLGKGATAVAVPVAEYRKHEKEIWDSMKCVRTK